MTSFSHVHILGPHGEPLHVDDATPIISVVESEVLTGTNQRTLDVGSREPQLVDAAGNPLASSLSDNLIVTASMDDLRRFVPEDATDTSAPIDQGQLLQLTLNPFRKTRELFEEAFSGDPSLDAVAKHTDSLLTARIKALELIRGKGFNQESAIEGVRRLEVSRGDRSIAYDFAPREDEYRYRQKGEVVVIRTERPSALEDALDGVLRKANEDPLYQVSAVRMLVYDTVGDVLRHVSRYSETPNPPLKALAATVVDLVEGVGHTREERGALYHLASEIPFTSAQSERLLWALSSHTTRFGPGDHRSDLDHPLAFQLLTMVRGDSSFESDFLKKQDETRAVLLELLSGDDIQSLFDRYDEVRELMDRLVYSGALKHDVVRGNCGLEIEYTHPSQERHDEPVGFSRGVDYGLDGVRELRQDINELGYDVSWEERLGAVTHYVKGEAPATLGTQTKPKFSIHYHVDQALTSERTIRDLFELFFYDPSRERGLGMNGDFDTWEIRGIVVPDHGTWINGARVTDVARLALLCSEDQAQTHEKISLDPARPYSHDHILWGHFLSASPSVEARMAALGALKDPRLFAVAEPTRLAKAFASSSQVKLLIELSYHVETINLPALNQRFGTFAVECLPSPHDQEFNQIEEALTRLLRSRSQDLMKTGLEYLGTYSLPQSSEKLERLVLKALADSPASHAADAVAALGMSVECVHRNWDTILALTQSDRENLRRASARVIHRHSEVWNQALEEQVVDDLSNQDPTRRRAAVRVLGTNPTLAARYAEAIVSRIGDSESCVAHEAMELCVENSGIEAVEQALVRGLQSQDHSLQVAVLTYASVESGFAIRHRSAINGFLNSESDELVHVAVMVLGSSADLLDEGGQQRLCELLGSSDPAMRRASSAVFASQRGLVDGTVVLELAKLIGDEDPEVCTNALTALSGETQVLRSHIPDAIPWLAKTSVDRQSEVQRLRQTLTELLNVDGIRTPRCEAALCDLVFGVAEESGGQERALDLLLWNTRSILRNAEFAARCLQHPNPAVHHGASAALRRVEGYLPRRCLDTISEAFPKLDHAMRVSLLEIFENNRQHIRHNQEILVECFETGSPIEQERAWRALCKVAPELSESLANRVVEAIQERKLHRDSFWSQEIVEFIGASKTRMQQHAALIEEMVLVCGGRTLDVIHDCLEKHQMTLSEAGADALAESDRGGYARLRILGGPVPTPSKYKSLLVPVLSQSVPIAQLWALRTLEQMPDQLDEADRAIVATQLFHEQPRIRHTAIRLLAPCGAYTDQCSQEFTSLLLDSDWSLEFAASASELPFLVTPEVTLRLTEEFPRVTDDVQRGIIAALGGTPAQAGQHGATLFGMRNDCLPCAQEDLCDVFVRNSWVLDEQDERALVAELDSMADGTRRFAERMLVQVPGLFDRYSDDLASLVGSSGIRHFPRITAYLEENPEAVSDRWLEALETVWKSSRSQRSDVAPLLVSTPERAERYGERVLRAMEAEMWSGWGGREGGAGRRRVGAGPYVVAEKG